MNLPERPDKLDAFSLSSSLTGFNAELLPGVKGEQVPNKSLPSLKGLPEKESERNNIVGCWRAHLNFARKYVAPAYNTPFTDANSSIRIVNDGLSTALVIEDDADWDLYLKDQLGLFAQGCQYVTGTSSSSPPHSPYGDNWDLLWLGHCSCQIKVNDQRRFIIENDQTVPSPDHRINFSDSIPDMQKEGFDNSTRVIFEANYGVCTYSYALSNRGAKKLLRYQNNMSQFLPIDLGLAKMCKEESDFLCVGVFPQIIDSHKAAGASAKDSDIVDYGKDGETRDKGFTFNIVHSVRLNLDRLLKGEKVGQGMTWRQWPEDPLIEGPARTRTMNRH